MRNWLLMFRPDTYEIVKDRGLIGVRYAHRKRFAELSEGDRFIAYVSRQRVLDGDGVLTSDPFEDVTPVWPTTQRYPERCRVRFDHTDAGVDASELLWHLSIWPVPKKTTPSNYLFCNGGFMELPEADYRLLHGILHGEPVPA